jgi:glycosyltransferase involved in cell wall biosynthesis
MAAGAVVVAFDSGSLPEVVGDAGRIVPEGDVEAMAGALDEVLRSPELPRLSAAARRRAMDTFAWEQVAAGFDRMYRQVLGNPSPVS